MPTTITKHVIDVKEVYNSKRRKEASKPMYLNSLCLAVTEKIIPMIAIVSEIPRAPSGLLKIPAFLTNAMYIIEQV